MKRSLRHNLGMFAFVVIGFAACGEDDDDDTGAGEQFGPLCTSMVEAGCSDAPEDVESCERSFSNALASCEPHLVALIDCAGESPTSSCDPSGVPIVEGCFPETANAFLCSSQR